MHLALGRHTPDGYQVAAIDNLQMARWQQLFSGWQHVRLDAIYPDAALLPATDGGWSLCLDGELMLLSQRGEWALQADNLPPFAMTMATPSEDEVVAKPVQVFGTETDLDSWQGAISEFSAAVAVAGTNQAIGILGAGTVGLATINTRPSRSTLPGSVF